MTYRTLGELESELLARLGMGAQGASGAAQAILRSFLRNGQAQMYRLQDWRHLIEYADKSLGVGQNQVDYPAGCARDRRVLRVETVEGGQWRQIPEGIRTEDWNHMDRLGYPIRVERLAQVLVYPKSDVIRTLRFWYVRDLERFTEQNDRAMLDDEMVLLHALATAKAHYRHPDAAMYQQQLADLYGRLRGEAFALQGVYRRDMGGPVEPRPLVVGRDI